MIYRVSIKYRDTGDHMPKGVEITVRGATPHEANERLQDLVDWLPDHVQAVLVNAVSLQ